MIEFVDHWWSAWSWSAIHFSWLVIAAALVTRIIRHWPAWIRQAIWASVILRGVCLLTVSLPVLPQTNEVTPQILSDAALPQETQTVRLNVEGQSTRVSNAAILDSQSIGTEIFENESDAMMDWLLIGFIVWGSGTVLFLSRVVLACRHRRQILQRHVRPIPAALERSWSAACKTMGVSPYTPVSVIEGPYQPMVCGIVRPRLVIGEACLIALSASQLELVLSHEAAHLKRGDLYWHLLAVVFTAIHWLNPFAWWAAGEFRSTREAACDWKVCDVLEMNPKDYCEELVSIASSIRVRQSKPFSPELGLNFASPFQEFRSRIGDLCSAQRPDQGRRWQCGVLLFLAIGVFCTCCRLVPVEAETLANPSIPNLHQDGKEEHSATRSELSTSKDDPALVMRLRRAASRVDVGSVGHQTGVVTRVDFVDGTDSDLDDLDGLVRLKELHLRGPGFTDAALHRLARHPHLRTLTLAKSKLTNTGLAQLTKIPSLESLTLAQLLQVDDDGLNNLRDLHQLKSLKILDMPIDGSGLECLSVMTQLRHLSLNGTQVSDDFIRHLSGLNRLQVLLLRKTNVSGEGFSHIDAKSLREIWLEGCQLTVAGAKELQRMKNLRRLTYSPEMLEDEVVVVLSSGFPNVDKRE